MKTVDVDSTATQFGWPTPPGPQRPIDAPRQATQTGRCWIVAKTHPKADDAGPGTQDTPLRTVSAAAFRAEPGDVVTVHEGVYYERVAPRYGGTPDCPIVYQAASGEKVVISGAMPWRPDWQRLDDEPTIFTGPLHPSLFVIEDPQRTELPLLPRSYQPFRRMLSASPLPNRRRIDLFGREHGRDPVVGKDESGLVVGQLFSDDEPLLQVAQRDDLRRFPGSWMVVEGGDRLLLHLPVGIHDPAQMSLEVTVRRCAFAPWRRGLGYIHVRGFIIERAASDFPRSFYQADGSPQAGVLSTRSGHHWLIEHNTIRFGTSLGLDIGTEGKRDGDAIDQPPVPRGSAGRHLIQHNLICDNGAGGIAGLGSYATQILHNRIERNNRLGFTAPETGGIKVHHFDRGRIEANLVRGNHCYGIWLDNTWHEARVSRNAILNNAGAGLFIELGNGPLLVDHNIISQTRPGVREPGDGIYSHDSSGVVLAHNLVIDNAHFGLWAHAATDRQTGVYVNGERAGREVSQCSNWHVTQNIFASNHAGEIALPPEHERSTRNRCDANAFAGTFDRWTHETFITVLDAPRFGLCDNKGRVDRVQLVNILLERLRALGAAELPNRADLLAEPRLDLDRWRLLTGFDVNSRYVAIAQPDVAVGNATLGFIVGRQLAAIPSQRIAGIDCDYFGTPLPDHPLPGPFQSLNLEPTIDPCISTKVEHEALDPRYANFLHLYPVPTF